MVPFNLSGSNTTTQDAMTRGGMFDAQGQFSFGGISTTGVGGSTTSAPAQQSYVAMIVIAVVVVGAAFLLMRK